MSKLIAIMIFAFPLMVSAASKNASQHVPSIADLKWPFVNFVILFGFLAWKLRRPIQSMFEKYCNEIKEFYRHSEERIKEANFKHDAAKEKISSINSHLQRVNDETNIVYREIEQTALHESAREIERMKKESHDMFENERNNRMKGIAEDLVNAIVKNTREKFSVPAKRAEYQNNVQKSL